MRPSIPPNLLNQQWRRGQRRLVTAPERLNEPDFRLVAMEEARQVYEVWGLEDWPQAFAALLRQIRFNYIIIEGAAVSAVEAGAFRGVDLEAIPVLCAYVRVPERQWLIDARLPATMLWLPRLARHLGAPVATIVPVSPLTLPRAAAAGARTFDEILVAQL